MQYCQAMERGETITRTVLILLLRCDLLAVPLLDTVMFVTTCFRVVVVVVATAVAFNRRGQYRPLMVREKRDGKYMNEDRKV